MGVQSSRKKMPSNTEFLRSALHPAGASYGKKQPLPSLLPLMRLKRGHCLQWFWAVEHIRLFYLVAHGSIVYLKTWYDRARKAASNYSEQPFVPFLISLCMHASRVTNDDPPHLFLQDRRLEPPSPRAESKSQRLPNQRNAPLHARAKGESKERLLRFEVLLSIQISTSFATTKFVTI